MSLIDPLTYVAEFVGIGFCLLSVVGVWSIFHSHDVMDGLRTSMDAILTGVLIIGAARIVRLCIQKILPFLTGTPSANRQRSPGQTAGSEQISRFETIQETKSVSKPSKPKSKKKTRAERRKEESDAIWAAIMRDEEELDDDEL